MKRLTSQDFLARINLLNPSVDILGEYINQKTKIKVKCKNCNHTWMGNPYDLLDGHGCPVCRYTNNSKKTRKSNEQFLRELREKSPNIEPLEEYRGAGKTIAVKCKVCEHIWKAQPNSLLSGHGCRNCAGLKKKTTKEFEDELASTNPNIELLSEYAGTHSRIRVRCRNCGHKWSPTARSLLSGRGCPKCIKIGTSFMEQFILAAFSMVLGEENVVSRDKSAIGMELDILLPTKCLAVEPGSWFWHQPSLEKDKKKRKKAQATGIRIITIYDSFPLSEEKPFAEDCFVFDGQLNEPGYHRLKALTLSLLSLAGETITPTEPFWDKIITLAHTGVAKISHIEFVDNMASISPTIEITGTFQNMNQKINVTCKSCGYSWCATPALLKGVGCVSCLGLKKLTTPEFVIALEKVNPSIKVLGEYINTSTKIKVQGVACGHIWEATPNSLLHGRGCRYCAGNVRKSPQQFISEMKIRNPKITIMGDYTNAHTKVPVRCNLCERVFLSTPNSLLSGHGCKACNIANGNKKRQGKTHLKTTDEFIKNLAVRLPTVEILGAYKNSKSPVRAKCKVCGHEWAPQAGTLLQKHGCPICQKNVVREKTSKQALIREWRVENPNGTKSQCARETGISKTTIYKW